MKMNLNTLRYVAAVARLGNFVKAAEECGVTQPSLSTAIGNLEIELGVTIFDRNAHPIRPTAIGAKIVEMARLTLFNAEQIEEFVRSERDGDGGKMNIGMIPTIAPYIIPGLFAAMRAAHPGIQLKISEMRTDFLARKIADAELDIAIMSTPLGRKGLLEIPLYYEKFVAYVSPDDPLYSLEELSSDRLPSERFWILEEGHCLRNQVLNFCHKREKAHNEYQAGSIDTLIRVVDLNGGYTVIPEMQLRFLGEEQRRNVRPLTGTGSDSIPVREVSLVVREDFARERQLNIIAECIKGIVPEEMLDTRLRRFAIKL